MYALFNLCFHDFGGGFGPGSNTGSSASDDKKYSAEVTYSEAEPERSAMVKC